MIAAVSMVLTAFIFSSPSAETVFSETHVADSTQFEIPISFADSKHQSEIQLATLKLKDPQALTQSNALADSESEIDNTAKTIEAANVWSDS